MPDFDPHAFDIQKFLQPFDIGAQKEEGQAFTGQTGSVADFISGLENPALTRQRYQKQFGVPQLRTQVQQLSEVGEDFLSQIQAMPSQVAGTTRESLVTEGQRQRLVQSGQKPIVENLGEINRALGKAQPALTAAEGHAADLGNLETQRQLLGLLPFEMGFDLLQQQQAREFSAYTFENQLELDRLLANQGAGVTLTEGERNRLNQLAVAEVHYRTALDSIKEQGSQARQTKRAPSDLGSLFGSIFG